MDNRTNTIAGWTLAALGTALAASIVGGMIFVHHGEPAKFGYPVEGVADASAGGGEAADTPIATRLASADPAKGADVFKKCAACHTINAGGANGVGPNLYHVVGDLIGQGRGYDFSAAVKAVGGNWDFDRLDAWLKSPRKFADGTKMTFAGLSNAQDRANVIAYLNAQGSNVPLPPPPAAGAAPAAATPTAGGNPPHGGSAAPGATSAVSAVQTDRRAATGDIANTGTPASGAPSVDPHAAARAAH